MLYALFVFTIIFASENPRTHQRQASAFQTVVWDRTSPKQLCSSFHSCPIAFMIQFFCCSSSLATATCFQTEQLLTQTMQSKIKIYITQTILFRLSTQYKGLTQSFWIKTRQNHHFFIGWDVLMAQYFQPMPGGFTNNFFFERQRFATKESSIDDQKVLYYLHRQTLYYPALPDTPRNISRKKKKKKRTKQRLLHNSSTSIKGTRGLVLVSKSRKKALTNVQ